jgi:hypothetical protein
MEKGITVMTPQPCLSTGPLTEAGKFESSKNALTHGLTAVNLDRFPESIRAEYAAFLEAQYLEWQPQSLNEGVYLERYAFNEFQLHRAQALHASALERLLADPNDEAAEKHYAKISRHVRALERSTKEALHELRTFIADRLASIDVMENLPEDAPFPSVFPAHRILAKPKLTADAARTAVRFVKDSSIRLEPVGPSDQPASSLMG